MDSESSIKNFTRGGQTFLHNFRMVNQIINRVAIVCFVFFILISLGLSYLLTTDYQRYLLEQWVWANASILFNDTAKQEFINPDGSIVKVFSKQILNATFIHEAIKEVSRIGIKVIIGGLVTTVLCFVVLYRWLRKRGEQQTETKQLRGDEIADITTVKKLIHRSTQVSDICVSGLPMPANFEVRHVFVHGTIGSGKSVFIKELLDQIRKRGDRAIIYDKGCDYIKTYYREGKDIILNPLDERTSSWHLWDECRDFADYDSMAAALMPMPNHVDNPYWISSARTVFSVTAAKMQKDKDRNMLKLLKLLLSADLKEIENYLTGTEAEILVSAKIEKTAVTIKSVLATYAKALKTVKDEDNPFSIRQWIQDDAKDSWLFISSLADKHETLKPLITMWLDIAVNSLMSLSPSPDRRIWIILDELPTLNRLPYLINALAEARKFGGCLVAGVQSIAQLREIYGNNGAEGISGLCNSKWFFRSPSFDTANWVSRELGQAEIEEVKEGVSYSESAMRTGISISKQQMHRQIVTPSDMMRLPDLESYVRLVGGYPITKVKLKFKKRETCADHFIARAMDEDRLNEIDQLIVRAEKPLIATDEKGREEMENVAW